MSIDTKTIRDLIIDTKTIRDLHAKRGDHPWGSSFEHAAYQHMPELLDAYDRLAELEAELASLRTDRDGAAEACRMLQEDKARLEQDNARLRGQISAMLGELEDFAMQNDLPIEDGHGYIGTGLPLRALQEWLFKQKDALAAGGDQ